MKHEEYTAGFFGKVATFFLHHKELGMLTVIGLIFWGILSFTLMPKQYNPEITAPAFQIVTEFPGATSEEVHQLVTRKMEDRIREIPTVEKIMSQSHDGGVSIVVAQFYIGEDVEDAKISLTQKLQSNMADKPLGVHEPHIIAIDPDDVPVMTLALTSDELSTSSLRALAHDVVDALKSVAQTSVVSIVGGAQKELRVDVDPVRLSTLGISVEQVVNVIKGNNMYVPAGDLTADGNHYNVRVVGTITSEKELENLVVMQKGQSIISLSDVATISYSDTEVTSHARLSTGSDMHRDAVYIAIAKRKGSNATAVTDAGLARIATFTDTEVIPQNVHVAVVRNDGQVAREATNTLTANLFSAIAIVAVVLLLFLGWRSALIVLISVPLTLAAVFGIGNFTGQSINRITLFALILSLGILVDAAIVVVENIFRLFKEYPTESKVGLIAQAVDEVGPGLLMSTTTVILAFVPMAFVGGMMGPYMGPIPFFVPAALIASLLIALSINPYLLNMITRKHGTVAQSHDGENPARENIFLRTVGKLRGIYGRFLSSLLESSKKRRRVMASVLVLLVISMALPAVGIVKFRMLPKADTEQFYIYLDLPQYASLERTDDVVHNIEAFMLAQDHVVSMQSFVGAPQIADFNGLFKGSSARTRENQATLKINLTHHKTRDITSEQIVLALRPALAAHLAAYPDVRTKLIEDPPGPPVLSTFLVKTQGIDEAHSARMATDIEAVIRTFDEVVDVDTTKNEATAEYVLRVKKEEASRAGLSVYDVAMTLRTLLSGERVAMYHASDSDIVRKAQQEYIVVYTQAAERDDKMDLDHLLIPNAYGQNIPLASIVSYEQDAAVPVMYTDQRAMTHYVSAEMGNRGVIYAMLDTLRYLVQEYKPFGEQTEVAGWNLFGVTYENQETKETAVVLLDGEWKLTLEVFRDLGIAMGVALVLIYFVLVARFRSLMIPALMMGTIPFSFIGVLPGFALLGWTNNIYFNATSMIGVIALSGIVVNNAIMLLEYLNRLRERGYAIEQAIIKAGKTRLLPIMLTSLTTILGSLTIISDPVWEGLAWSIVMGLSLSVFLTLVIFPILYYKFQRKEWQKPSQSTSHR